MTTELVSLKGIVKRYVRGKQRVQVLHGIDLEIRAGEFLALMGPSGSGKTTLLNLIGGIDRADEGDLLVAGERINALTARQLAQWRAHNVGFVFQHKPAELSGGQQQRVAIARALVADPTLLVCDEPTGDLDREMAEQILDLLQIVNREQRKTIIMVTHDPKAAERATRQLHLDKGRLIDADSSLAA